MSDLSGVKEPSQAYVPTQAFRYVCAEPPPACVSAVVPFQTYVLGYILNSFSASSRMINTNSAMANMQEIAHPLRSELPITFIINMISFGTNLRLFWQNRDRETQQKSNRTGDEPHPARWAGRAGEIWLHWGGPNRLLKYPVERASGGFTPP